MINIAFTGHRKVRDEDRVPISRGFLSLAKMFPDEVHTGGAAGFDTDMFYLAYAYGMNNVLHVPFQYQLDALIKEVKPALAYYTVCPTCGPRQDYIRPTDNYLYQKRNEHMVDQLVNPDDMLVTYFNGQPSGTKNCIEYAKRQGKTIVDIRELS